MQIKRILATTGLAALVFAPVATGVAFAAENDPNAGAGTAVTENAAAEQQAGQSEQQAGQGDQMGTDAGMAGYGAGGAAGQVSGDNEQSQAPGVDNTKPTVPATGANAGKDGAKVKTALAPKLAQPVIPWPQGIVKPADDAVHIPGVAGGIWIPPKPADPLHEHVTDPKLAKAYITQGLKQVANPPSPQSNNQKGCAAGDSYAFLIDYSSSLAGAQKEYVGAVQEAVAKMGNANVGLYTFGTHSPAPIYPDAGGEEVALPNIKLAPANSDEVKNYLDKYANLGEPVDHTNWAGGFKAIQDSGVKYKQIFVLTDGMPDRNTYFPQNAELPLRGPDGKLTPENDSIIDRETSQLLAIFDAYSRANALKAQGAHITLIPIGHGVNQDMNQLFYTPPLYATGDTFSAVMLPMKDVSALFTDDVVPLNTIPEMAAKLKAITPTNCKVDNTNRGTGTATGKQTPANAKAAVAKSAPAAAKGAKLAETGANAKSLLALSLGLGIAGITISILRRRTTPSAQ